MSFVAMDGFAARLETRIGSTDSFVRIRKAMATPLLAFTDGQYTWLVIHDRVHREVVKFSDVANIVDVGQGLIDLPITRLTTSGVAYNFPCHSVISYQITTPVVREIVSAYLTAQGIS